MDIDMLQQELTDIAKEELSQKMTDFFGYLNYQDLMIVRRNDKTNKRWQELDNIFVKFVNDNLTEVQLKKLLSGQSSQEDNPLQQIFRKWVDYHISTPKFLEKSQLFFQITFTDEDLQLLSNFPDNASHPRIVELLFAFSEFYDGITDIKGTEKNIYPDRFKETTKTVRYRGDVANWVGKKTEEVTEIERIEQPETEQISKVENEPVKQNSKYPDLKPPPEGYLWAEWISMGGPANGSIEIMTAEGRKKIFRDTPYLLSEVTFQLAQREKRKYWHRIL